MANKPTGYQKQLGKLGYGEKFLGVNDTLNQGRSDAANAINNYGNRTGPSLDAAQQEQFRSQQGALAAALAAQANGTGGPSPAELMLRRQGDMAAKSAAAQIGSTYGINPAVAATMQNQATSEALNQYAGQAAEIRAQEQQAAQGQLAGLLGQARSQDIGMSQANLEAELRQRGYNDDVIKQMLAQQNQLNMQQSAQRQQELVTAYNADIARKTQNKALAPAYTGAVVGAAGAVGAAAI
jgi:hypothetical protein